MTTKDSVDSAFNEAGQTTTLAPASPLKILIIDDHPLIRQIVRKILDVDPRFEVIGEAGNGLEGLAQVEAFKPDVVILNITMPVLDGFDAARRIRKQFPEIAIVILSTDADERFIIEARKVGARAYVPKSEAATSLIKAIDAAIKNEEFFVVK